MAHVNSSLAIAATCCSYTLCSYHLLAACPLPASTLQQQLSDCPDAQLPKETYTGTHCGSVQDTANTPQCLLRA